jgi:hypothetical protein
MSGGIAFHQHGRYRREYLCQFPLRGRRIGANIMEWSAPLRQGWTGRAPPKPQICHKEIFNTGT